MSNFTTKSHLFCRAMYLAVVCSAMVAPFAAKAVEAEGKARAEVQKELYGSASQPGPTTRIEDVGQSARLTVNHGETVTFRSQGQQFTWTFDGLEHQGLPLARIAPPGFPARDATVHIGRNPQNRGR